MKAVPILLLTALTLAVGATRADTLLVDAVEQAPPNRAEGLLRPNHGMSMAAVERTFGEPSERYAPVGAGGPHPPIARWVYPAFTVYFENQIVLTSVVHRAR
jgi:hypothetical protein